MIEFGTDGHPPSRASDPLLRDALRGVATLAGLAKDALRPVAPFLPGPLRMRFADGLQAIEAVTRERGAPWPEPAALRAARAFVAGTGTRVSDADACARCLAAAWDHLMPVHERRRPPLFSEALAAAALRGLPARSRADATPRPSAIVAAVLHSGASHALPDRARGVLFPALVWLLADPAASPSDEAQLLDLARALTAAALTRQEAATLTGAALDSRLLALATHL
jgi:hypothetical protein